MELTPKQQTSEAIRQAETILIITGSHPSVDQATAVVGLAAILRKFGKRVSAVMSDGLPASVASLDGAIVERNLGGMRDFILKLDVTKAEVDKLRTELDGNKLNIMISPLKGSFAPSDVTFDYGQPNFEYDLAIVLGVPARSRIDRLYEQNQELFSQIPLVNLDFHRSNEQYGAINLIDGNASSLCEMLVATSESLQSGLIDAEIGTILLMGIMAATDRFTAAHTTSKSLTVAAQMMAAGGRQPAVVKALYRDSRGDRNNNERSSDRSNDRPDRGDRNDRNRNANNQRDGGQQRAEQPRQETPKPAMNRPEAESQPEARTPQPTQAPQPSQPEAPALAPEPVAATVVAPVLAPAAPVWRSEPQPTQDLPIIEPSHIEPSGSAEQPRLMDEPTPVAADFAAAAELLTQGRLAEANQSAQPARSADSNPSA